eukprot:134886-Alexandrium_andersonii.AAC.1
MRTAERNRGAKGAGPNEDATTSDSLLSTCPQSGNASGGESLQATFPQPGISVLESFLGLCAANIPGARTVALNEQLPMHGLSV